MRDLALHEQFEIEILEYLNSRKLLDPLLFCGGTMLRLCYGLDRYSVDLDFWLIKRINFIKYLKKANICLQENYIIKDAENKKNTIIFEIKSSRYPRSLKIEIRKKIKEKSWDNSIAYSPHANKQVMVKSLKLRDMMSSKIDAFINRAEIRDCFDMEFLIKKGIKIIAPEAKLNKITQQIAKLSKADYKVKLGSIIEPGTRKYYIESNFKILINEIQDSLP